MHHHSAWTDPTFWRTMALSPFGLWFIGILLFYTQKSGLYGKQEGSRIRYAKPMQQRMSFLVFATSFPWIATYFGPLPQQWPLYLVFVLLLPLGLIYLSGPSEVVFDLNRRSYTAKFGWPFAPKVWAGPLSDVRKLDVGSSDSTRYLIVRWKQKRIGIIIGTFGTRAKAEAAAAEVSRLLNDDIPTKTSGLFSRGVL